MKFYAMNAIRGRVTQSGRVSLPAELRRAIGLDRGGEVVFELEGQEIRIRTVEEVVRSAQRLTRQLIGDKPGADVSSFLAERRAEAKREP
jgi:AbrB family looped-hinge helix DNA binding protein